MCNQANSSRRDAVFQVGDWVFVKLQPYRQTSIAHRQSHKLARRFYGPFEITARIGPVAYRLALPDHAKIHNVFHISKLKLCKGDPFSEAAPLPSVFLDDKPVLQPAKILGFRTVLIQGRPVQQVLIQWESQPASDATWEMVSEFTKDFPSFALEDKVSFEGGSNDASPTMIASAHGNQNLNITRRSSRTKRVPAKYMD